MSAGDIVRSKGSIHIARLPQLVDDWVEETALAAGKEPYGDVPYGDPGYLSDKKKRYPIDCKHVKAAWSYVHQKKNAGQYTSDQLARIKSRIAAAYKRCFGEEPPSLKQ